MGEAGRNVHLPMVLVTQLPPHPFAEMRRLPPHVDRDIENPSRNGLHELGLRMLSLKVQPAKRSPAGTGNIVLHKFGRNPGFGIAVTLVRFLKKAARVRKDLRLDHHHAREFGRNHIHGRTRFFARTTA